MCCFRKRRYIIPNKSIRLYFVLGLILADNLGMHKILGFRNHFCKIYRNDLYIKTTEDVSLLRTKEQYEHDLALNEVSETGIKGECIFNNLASFHVVTNFSVDIMHDLYEGLCHYDFAQILNYFIYEKEYFSLNEFNDRKAMFAYGSDIGNISQPVLLDHIKRHKLNTSASEMRCLFHFLTLFVGDKVPTKDVVWKFLIKIVKILDIFEKASCSEEEIEQLRLLIKEHYKFYITFFKEKLKPKHHYMLHLPNIIKNVGPLSGIWCMRLEAKHKELKKHANNISSRVNLPMSIMIKQQLAFANRVVSQSGFTEKIECGHHCKNNNENWKDNLEYQNYLKFKILNIVPV